MDNTKLSATWPEMMKNLNGLMNDPNAQAKWASELDAQGFFVSFGVFPYIGSKDIHLSSKE